MEDLELLKNSIVPNREKWENTNFTNCLAYALNTDISFMEFNLFKEYLLNIYELGLICNYYKDYYSDKEVIDLLYIDCDILDLDITKVSEDYELKKQDEWLVAVYNSPMLINNGEKESEYHFIKKEYNKNWLSKPGVGNITNTDYNDEIISTPSKAYFEISDDKNDFIPLKYLGTYKLRKKTLN